MNKFKEIKQMHVFNEIKEKAEAGDMRYQSILAGMYYFGQGTACSTAEALRWFTKAGIQGDRFSQMQVIKMKLERMDDRAALVDTVQITALFNNLVDNETNIL